jgi:hypothetical protein
MWRRYRISTPQHSMKAPDQPRPGPSRNFLHALLYNNVMDNCAYHLVGYAQKSRGQGVIGLWTPRNRTFN